MDEANGVWREHVEKIKKLCLRGFVRSLLIGLGISVAYYLQHLYFVDIVSGKDVAPAEEVSMISMTAKSNFLFFCLPLAFGLSLIIQVVNYVVQMTLFKSQMRASYPNLVFEKGEGLKWIWRESVST